MNKELLFQELANKISTGEISREEVTNRFGMVSVNQTQSVVSPKEEKHMSITKIMYVIGAAIVVIGILIFVGQIWEDIGSLGRITVTLGLGVLFAGIGAVLLNSKPQDNIGPVFHAIGGLLIPGGAMITLSELSTGQNHPWIVAMIFGIIFLFYFLLTSVQKNVVLTLFTLANGTAFIYLLINAMLGDSFYSHGDIYAYLTMIVGAVYLVLAYGFEGGWNQKLVDSLYFLGSAAFLGAAFSRVFDSMIWQLVFFFIVIAGLFLSTQIKSRNVLIVSTLFLVAHISYITSKYFADSLGWPVSLIMLGLVFIGLGYVSININKNYIAK